MLAEDVILKLKEGNKKYIENNKMTGDVSQEKRSMLKDSQKPYAIILACSDSRTLPEVIFSAGLGELFVVRVAGNVVGDHELGSIEYAANVLGANLLLVLGHTHCGAVNAAMKEDQGGHIKVILDQIREAIDTEKDDHKASCMNVNHSIAKIKDQIQVGKDFKIIGGVYDIESGIVEFI